MERSAALVLYEKVVNAMTGVERKGDTMPYTSLNGHMFCVLHKDDTLALRLPADVRAAYIAGVRPNTTPVMIARATANATARPFNAISLFA